MNDRARPPAFRWLTRWSYFDRGSSGDRYVRRRTWMNLALVLTLILLAKGADRFVGPGSGRIVVVAAGLLFAVWIPMGILRYIRHLDEMQRQIHLESIAVSYALIMAAAVGFGVLSMAFGWTFNPLYLVGFELVRGAALSWLTWRRA